LLENKFKATPSTNQLALYDDALKDKKNENAKKFLMVFSLDQLPSDVSVYCKDNDWAMKTYFAKSDKSNDSKNVSLLTFLKSLDLSLIKCEKKKFLIQEYRDYLECIFEQVKVLTQDEKYLTSSTISNKSSEKHASNKQILNSRELHFQYLLYIQSLITGRLENKGFEFKSNNDGVKNNIPSIALWKDSKEEKKSIKSLYFGIDGDSLKVGVLFKRKDGELIRNEVELIQLEMEDKITKDIHYLIPTKQNPSKIKMDKNSTKLSVFSLFTFKVVEGSSKEEVVNDAVKLVEHYFDRV
jgi:hypothetical protein